MTPEKLRQYARWEVPVPKGTALASLKTELEKEAGRLPEKDLEDSSPLPLWFRVYLRKTFPDLPRSGAYQYPRTANRILQRMVDNPDSVERPKSR